MSDKYTRSDNYFQGTVDNPTHLSIGAVLVNGKGQIACHYHVQVRDLKDVYTLMRETIEPDESIEQALQRGLMEEFGASGKLERYLGSIVSSFKRGPKPVEKTTLYFLVRLTNHDTAKRVPGHDEWESDIQWQTADFLTSRMKLQSRYSDLDESTILARAKKYL